MRWLLAVLLLANGVAFYWFSSSSEVVATPEVRPNPGIAQLMLLSERSGESHNLSGECVVVGPVMDLAQIESLSAALTDRNVAHQRWSVASDTGSGAPVYWLQFSTSLQGRLERQFWFDILSQSPNTEISQKNCTAVASVSDFP